jgi:hypothetical protein
MADDFGGFGDDGDDDFGGDDFGVWTGVTPAVALTWFLLALVSLCGSQRLRVACMQRSERLL